ncbi:DUF3987 domain-containing protein [Methylomonas sp. BW4-1]|uniref:DUF3987 domain-containing protein n=1 Tax=Methylomonas sp. BW4-1 TaxID=3376685 RepID=UPI0040422F13
MSNLDKLAALEALTKPITEKAVKRARKYGSTKAVPENEDFLGEMLEGFQEEEFVEDAIIAPPQPTPAMFYGFVGEVARVAADGTEINPVAAAMVMLSFLGANAGRDSFLLINNTFHHPRLFTMHIGRSSSGGKGDSQQLVHRIRRYIEAKDAALLGRFHSGGLSTREGLAAMIHDGFGESPAIVDKRLWVIESEFANVLHQSKREGNTLSSAIREVWDGGDIKPATKSKTVGVTNPHIGIHANITPAELNKMLSAGEMTNGFANRFLMVWAENVGFEPFPKPTPERIIEDLAGRVMDILHFAKGGYPNSHNGLEMMLSQAAKQRYAEAYPSLRRPIDNEFVASLVARRAPYALRLAMLFALTDQTRVIEVCHLETALAWTDYALQTVKFVFADKASDPRQAETRQQAAKILAFLRLRPEGSSKWELTNDCFQKHSTSQKIDAALRYLLAENPPKIVQTEAKNGGRGRPKTIYTLQNSAEKINKSASRAAFGLEGDLPTAEKMRSISDEMGKNGNTPQFSAVDENGVNPEPARPAELNNFSASFSHGFHERPAETHPPDRPKPKAANKKV